MEGDQYNERANNRYVPAAPDHHLLQDTLPVSHLSPKAHLDTQTRPQK